MLEVFSDRLFKQCSRPFRSKNGEKFDSKGDFWLLKDDRFMDLVSYSVKDETISVIAIAVTKKTIFGP
jgi:hypothetical protein